MTEIELRENIKDREEHSKMQLEAIAKALANLDLKNSENFWQIFAKLMKEHPVTTRVFIVLGQIVRTYGVKPGQSMQLALELEDSYTHQMIIEQKYCEKVEVTIKIQSAIHGATSIYDGVFFSDLVKF